MLSADSVLCPSAVTFFPPLSSLNGLLFQPWGISPTPRPCPHTHTHTHSPLSLAHTQQHVVWPKPGSNYNCSHSCGTPRSCKTWIMHQQEEFLFLYFPFFYMLLILRSTSQRRLPLTPPGFHLYSGWEARRRVTSCTLTRSFIWMSKYTWVTL